MLAAMTLVSLLCPPLTEQDGYQHNRLTDLHGPQRIDSIDFASCGFSPSICDRNALAGEGAWLADWTWDVLIAEVLPPGWWSFGKGCRCPGLPSRFQGVSGRFWTLPKYQFRGTDVLEPPRGGCLGACARFSRVSQGQLGQRKHAAKSRCISVHLGASEHTTLRDLVARGTLSVHAA